MVSVMVGVAVAGRVTSSVSGTGVGGNGAVGVAVSMTGVEELAEITGARSTLAVGESAGAGVLVLCGGCMAKGGPPFPPLIRTTSVATRTAASATLIRNPGTLAGRKRIAMSVSNPNMPAHAK